MKSTAGSSQVACFGAFKVDLRAGELLKNGRRIRLQEQPFQILAMLLEHPGEVVTREELRLRLWPADTFVDFDHGLNNAINRLREALSDSADSPRYIETLSRRGYRFIAPVNQGAPATAHASAAASPPSVTAEAATLAVEKPSVESPALSKAQPRLRSLWFAGLAFAALLVTLVGFNVSELRQRLLGRSHPPRINSIAVLPLENLTGDASQEYFADGMTDALTTELAQTAPIRVISRTSAMQYKGKHKPLREIAQDLNVDAVVEGSVARSGNRVRITAQLIYAPADRHLWAASYERELSDILALQGEVSRAIANQVEIKLSPERQVHLASLRQVNPQAYEAYLRGIAYMETENERENEAAIVFLERATTLDPNFALAHASLARAYLWRYFVWDPGKVWTERASRSVGKAISLDPKLADAYVARGQLARTLGKPPYQEGIQDFRRALSLNPNLADAHYQLGELYLHIGLLDKSLEELQAAVALDPRSPFALYRIARVYLYQQQYAKALAGFERRGFSPDWQRALTLGLLGRTSEAFEFIEKLEKDFPHQEDVASTYAVLLAARGEKKRAEEKIRIAIEAGQGKLHFHHAEYNIASAYALMGKNRLALQWLQKTAADGLPSYPLFEKDPHLSSLRSDPGFIAFMDKMKSQWEQYKATL